jgi:hypothetical protein
MGKLSKGIGFPVDFLSVVNMPLKRGQEGGPKYKTNHKGRLRKAATKLVERLELSE